MGLLILAFPVIEIWSWFFVGARIGFANTVFWFLATFVLGLGLIRAQGSYLLRNLQASLASGKVPTTAIVFTLFNFLAGALFMIPGFFSDALAIALIFPGIKHLLARALRTKLEKKMREGSFRMASFGNFGGKFGGFGSGFGGGFSEGFGNREGFGTGPRSDRDVTPKQLSSDDRGDDIIDVTPIKPPGSDPK